jgi:hypothetical protein
MYGKCVGSIIKLFKCHIKDNLNISMRIANAHIPDCTSRNLVYKQAHTPEAAYVYGYSLQH